MTIGGRAVRDRFVAAAPASPGGVFKEVKTAIRRIDNVSFRQRGFAVNVPVPAGAVEGVAEIKTHPEARSAFASSLRESKLP